MDVRWRRFAGVAGLLRRNHLRGRIRQRSLRDRREDWNREMELRDHVCHPGFTRGVRRGRLLRGHARLPGELPVRRRREHRDRAVEIRHRSGRHRLSSRSVRDGVHRDVRQPPPRAVRRRGRLDVDLHRDKPDRVRGLRRRRSGLPGAGGRADRRSRRRDRADCLELFGFDRRDNYSCRRRRDGLLRDVQR